MRATLDEVSHILQTHHIDVDNLEELAINPISAPAFALEIDPSLELDAWHLFRRLVPQTQRYPVLVEDWIGGHDFFSNYWYEGERSDGLIPDITPEAILAAVSQADIGAYLQQREASTRSHLLDAIEYERSRTQAQFGTCPTEKAITSLVEQNSIQSTVDLERWLFDWERKTFGDELALRPLDTSYLDWFESHSGLSLNVFIFMW